MCVCTKCAGVSCKSILVPFRIIILLIRRAQANWIGNFLMMNDLPERSCAVHLMSSFSIDSFNCCSTIYCYCNCMNELTHCVYIYCFDDFVIFMWLFAVAHLHICTSTTNSIEMIWNEIEYSIKSNHCHWFFQSLTHSVIGNFKRM